MIDRDMYVCSIIRMYMYTTQPGVCMYVCEEPAVCVIQRGSTLSSRETNIYFYYKSLFNQVTAGFKS